MLSSAAALPEAKPWRASSSRAKGTEKEVLRGAENSVKSCGGCWVEWRKGARAQLTAAAGRKGAGPCLAGGRRPARRPHSGAEEGARLHRLGGVLPLDRQPALLEAHGAGLRRACKRRGRGSEASQASRLVNTAHIPVPTCFPPVLMARRAVTRPFTLALRADTGCASSDIASPRAAESSSCVLKK